jgi:sporulenol synthase
MPEARKSTSESAVSALFVNAASNPDLLSDHRLRGCGIERNRKDGVQMDTLQIVNRELLRLTEELLNRQANDGSWRFCFENGTAPDCYMIIVLRTLRIADENTIRLLHDRILAEQHENGSWKLFHDEEDGNLSATVEAYYALLYSGCSRKTDEPLRKAKRFILSKGGIRNADSLLTNAMLAATGQLPWPESLKIPLEFMLLPPSAPVSLFEFSGYARVHLVPILIMSDRQFRLRTDASPDLSELAADSPVGTASPSSQRLPFPGISSLLDNITTGIAKLAGLPGQLHKLAVKRAERFLLERIEPDGTLYSYASSTFLMIFALLAIGYDRQHPVIIRAVRGLTAMLCSLPGKTVMQNSPSAVWDTALLTHALQEAGLAAESPAIRNAAGYLIGKQQRKSGDWSLHNPNSVPGGWGFSDSNTINPDVDDTTAALRAIKRFSRIEPAFREAWNRGLNWILSMQNDDGGWPAFEKNTDNSLLTMLPIEGADAAATDPSTADLTGRTLEYLGNSAGIGITRAFIRRGAVWLLDHQQQDGSWYGRWGICYIYGTWSAVTGLAAAGLEADHPAMRSAVRWLLDIQHPDGGWGESCRSDQVKRYVPFGRTVLSQTAWALDALIAVHPQPSPQMDKGIHRLAAALHDEDGPTAAYPTGAGLPGNFYGHYHSYRYIWPLLTLAHYKRKYES